MDILTPSESPLQLLLNSHRWTSAKNSSSPVGVMLPEAREAQKEQSLLQHNSSSQYLHSLHWSLRVLPNKKFPFLLYSLSSMQILMYVSPVILSLLPRDL